MIQVNNLHCFEKALHSLENVIEIKSDKVPLQLAIKDIYNRKIFDVAILGCLLLSGKKKWIGLLGLVQLYRHRHIWRYSLHMKNTTLRLVKWI